MFTEATLREAEELTVISHIYFQLNDSENLKWLAAWILCKKKKKMHAISNLKM